MKTCFFIGHRDAPETLSPLLAEAVERHIRLCKALAACYELHEYIANRLGEMVDRGEIGDQ